MFQIKDVSNINFNPVGLAYIKNDSYMFLQKTILKLRLSWLVVWVSPTHPLYPPAHSLYFFVFSLGCQDLFYFSLFFFLYINLKKAMLENFNKNTDCIWLRKIGIYLKLNLIG